MLRYFFFPSFDNVQRSSSSNRIVLALFQWSKRIFGQKASWLMDWVRWTDFMACALPRLCNISLNIECCKLIRCEDNSNDSMVYQFRTQNISNSLDRALVDNEKFLDSCYFILLLLFRVTFRMLCKTCVQSSKKFCLRTTREFNIGEMLWSISALRSVSLLK